MAMAIFSLLGLLVVVLMRQGMTVFASGTRGGLLQDRMASTLPQLERNLRLLALPASFDPPPPPPTEEEMMDEAEYVPPPPVDVRVRSTLLTLRDVPEGPLKDLPVFFAAWVVDVGGKRSDPLLRAAGDRSGPDLRHIEPKEIDAANANTMFLPSGGLQEVCYVAVAEDEEYPALLTLYFGWRSPVGGPDTLLDEKNFDTLREIKERCRPVARGVLHLSVLWRRVFALNWDLTPGRVGETEPYVGHVWDSTRALDPKFGLFRDPKSLGDPSDDVFPAWARLEITLAAPSALGFGKGETYLTEGVGDGERKIRVAHPRMLLGPGPSIRYLKVDGEWMSYRVNRVNPVTGEVPVERGQRNTPAMSHDSDAYVYLGLGEARDVRLLFRDRFARSTGSGQ